MQTGGFFNIGFGRVFAGSKFQLFQFIKGGICNGGFFDIGHLFDVEIELCTGRDPDIVGLFGNLVGNIFQSYIGQRFKCCCQSILGETVVAGNNGTSVIVGGLGLETCGKSLGKCHCVLQHLVEIVVVHHPSGNACCHIGNGGFAFVACLIGFFQYSSLQLQLQTNLIRGDLPDQHEVAGTHHPVTDAFTHFAVNFRPGRDDKFAFTFGICPPEILYDNGNQRSSIHIAFQSIHQLAVQQTPEGGIPFRKERLIFLAG